MPAVLIRETVISALSADSVVIPNSARPGDLLLLYAANYNTDPTTVPAGWTPLVAQSGTSTYTAYGRVLYRVSEPGDAGVTVSLPIAGTAYGGLVLLVLDRSSLVGFSSAGSSTSSIATGTGSVSERATRLMFVAQMANSSTVPTFTPPGGITTLGSIPGTAWFRMSVYSELEDTLAGTAPELVVTSNSAGGGVGISVYVRSRPPYVGQLWPRGG